MEEYFLKKEKQSESTVDINSKISNGKELDFWAQF